MRIRTKGKHKHRTDTIERAAEFWGCNKTKALMKSADFTHRIDTNLRIVLSRQDLTLEQKFEIAERLSVPGLYEIRIEENVVVEYE